MRKTNKLVDYMVVGHGGDWREICRSFEMLLEFYSKSAVTLRPNGPATLCLGAALSRHPPLIKGVYTGHLIRCDNRPGSDSNLKPNMH